MSAETFSALAFSTTSLLSFGPIVKTIHRGKLGPFNTFAVIWILISIAYLLFIVTMADLMTGYVTGEMTWVSVLNQLSPRPSKLILLAVTAQVS